MTSNPFTPTASTTLAVTSTSGRVALPNANSNQVRLSGDAGSTACYLVFGDVTSTAVATTYLFRDMHTVHHKRRG